MRNNSGIAGIYVLIITLIALTAVMIVIAPARRDMKVATAATSTVRSF